MALDAETLKHAAALTRLAGEFDAEARAWGDYPRISKRCHDTVNTLTDAARYVLRSGDTAWGEGWTRAGQLTLGQLQLARLFRDGATWKP